MNCKFVISNNDTMQLAFRTQANIQLFQLRLSPSKAEKSNTSAKSLLGMTSKNTQTVSGDT